MNYAALASALVLALFFVAGPLLVFVIPTVRRGGTLSELAPVFLFIVAMPTLLCASAWLSAARQSTDLAHRLARVLEARPEAVPSMTGRNALIGYGR